MKRKIIVCISIMITSLQMNAQFSYKTEQLSNNIIANISNNETDSLLPIKKVLPLRHKYYIGLMSSLDYIYFSTNLKNDPFLISLNKNYGYNFGLKLQYYYTDNFSLRTGISFSRYYYYFRTYTFRISINNAPWVYSSPEDFLNKLDYIHLPFMLGYSLFSAGNFKLTPSLGANINIATDNIHLIIAPQFNLGFEYFFLKNKLCCTLEPYVNYALINTNDNQTNLYLDSKYVIGGIFSVNYHF